VLSYVVRRLLYSVVVLVAASFLVFTFVSVSGDPLAQLNIIPNVSEQSRQNVIDSKHLDDPIPVQYGYWVKDAVTNQFGTTLLGDRPILPDLWRVMKNTLQLVLVAELLAIAVDHLAVTNVLGGIGHGKLGIAQPPQRSGFLNLSHDVSHFSLRLIDPAVWRAG